MTRREGGISAGDSVSRAPKRLAHGIYIAPFRGWHGGVVLLNIFRGGQLFHLAEVTAMLGSRVHVLGAPGRTTAHRDICAAEPWDFLPSPERLLPRGVHCAPWVTRPRVGAERSAPVLIAIDADHRLVGAMAVSDGASEAAVRTELAVVLDVVEGATRPGCAVDGSREPIPLVPGHQFRRYRHGYPRGVYVQTTVWGDTRITVVTADQSWSPIAVDVSYSARASVTPIARALWGVLEIVDPPNDGEAWMRGAQR